MDGRISNLLAITIVFSLLLNFFVPLSSALEKNSTRVFSNSDFQDNWASPQQENSQSENSQDNFSQNENLDNFEPENLVWRYEENLWLPDHGSPFADTVFFVYGPYEYLPTNVLGAPDGGYCDLNAGQITVGFPDQRENFGDYDVTIPPGTDLIIFDRATIDLPELVTFGFGTPVDGDNDGMADNPTGTATYLSWSPTLLPFGSGEQLNLIFFDLGDYGASNPIPQNLFVSVDDEGDLDVDAFEIGIAPEEVHWVENGLVGWWRFEEGPDEIANDNSGFGNTGTIHGATWVDGKIGKALSFDGTGYVEFPATVYRQASELTVAFWVRAQSSDTYRAIMAKAWAANNPGVWLVSGKIGGNIVFTLITEQGRKTLYSTSVLDDNWTHVALGYDGENMKIYTNGIEDASVSQSGMLFPTLDSIFVGRSGKSTADMWIGDVDEVRIYTRSLSPTEIWELYQAGLGITPLSSSVDPIDPYWRNEVPFTVTATTGGTVENVELWYCHSPDNSTWGAWENFGFGSPIGDNKWYWSFTAPENDGYYEFYSIAVGSREKAPKDENGNIVPDARAGVDTMPPSSIALQFEGDDYWKEVKNLESDSFTVSAVAVDGLSGVEDVELWYRYSLDNWTDDVAWKKRGWQRYGVDDSPQPYGTLFEDEFDGQTLDQTKWDNAYEDGVDVGTTSIQLHDSQLRMVAESPDGELAYYLRSRTAITYGALEVRAKAPSWDNSDGAVDWVRLGFMDTPPLANDVVMVRLNGGVRFKSKTGTTFTDTEVTGDLDAREYHTYKIIWAPGEARLYVDGELVATHEVGVPSTPLYPILLTYSRGAGDSSELWVDYVRMRPAYRAEWEFTPEQYGYYEFFSAATDAAGNRENENAKMFEPGEANVRVAEDVVDVAVILAKPNDSPHDSLQTWEYFKENTTDYLIKYYDEASYGALAVRFAASDKNAGGNWYQVAEHWHDPWGYVDDAVKTASGDFDFNLIDIAVVVPPTSYEVWDPNQESSIGGAAFGQQVETTSGNVWPTIISYWGWIPETRPGPDSPQTGVWAHEIAHQLGVVIGDGTQLPDLSSMNSWELMDSSRPFVHLSSWSKARLGWLDYKDVGSGWYDINALPTLSYSGDVYRYKQHEWDFLGYGGKTWYLLEVRVREPSEPRIYSSYDWSVPDNGLVIYKIEETYDWFGSSTRVGVVNGVPFVNDPDRAIWYDSYEDVSLVYEAKDGKTTRFWIWEETADADTYKMLTSINEGTDEWEEAEEMEQYYTGRGYNNPYDVPYEDFYFATAENTILPDQDLHAYTLDGRHIGVNYETGEYEIQIENASASGDMFQMSEWISVPSDVEVYFTTSARDVQKFLNEHPDVQIENGFYAFDVMYSDNMRNDYIAPMVGQEILPGAEIFHDFDVTQKPDGTYSLDVKSGMNLLSLEAWQAAIDNVPDNGFAKNSAQRKQALKNKLGAVFSMLAENNYNGAVEKLTNDVLKKLDGDGKADWVTQPALADELSAFIGMLRYKTGGGED